jgi:hypothetical protein
VQPRFVEPRQPGERMAAILLCLGKAWIELDRLLELREGFLVAPWSEQRPAEVIIECGDLRAARERALDPRQEIRGPGPRAHRVDAGRRR